MDRNTKLIIWANAYSARSLCSEKSVRREINASHAHWILELAEGKEAELLKDEDDYL